MTMLTANANAGPQLNADELSDLLNSVNVVTRQLHDTHRSLQQQVARLQNELSAAHAQLERSRALAALGEMAAGIAHEIRNPVASIQLYAQALAEDLAEQPEQRAFCDKMRFAIERLDAIVGDVLTFARDTSVRTRTVASERLFDDAITTCEVLLAQHDVTIERNGSIDFPCDGALVVRALSNVIQNAAQAMAAADVPHATIRLLSKKGKHRDARGATVPRGLLIIEDCGPGIPDDVISRMFNPFFTTRAAGTGLGLAIVHRIVDAHGGEVNVCAAQSGGARIELAFPIEVEPGAGKHTSSTDPHGGDTDARHTHKHINESMEQDA